jgi:Tol biopolymer transport system component/DNA-binding winged helix-turn-helix (wHTH) protein
MSDNDANRLRFGPFEVDVNTHELRKGGAKVRLVGQPFQILAMLISRPGGLVTREELRRQLWPSDTFVDFDHGLNAAVNKLRETLCDSADEPRYVETVPRRGYRFIAKVEPLSKSIETEVAPLALERPPAAGDGTTQMRGTPKPRPPKPRPPMLSRSLVTVGVLVFLILGAIFVSSIVSRERARDKAQAARITPLTDLADATMEAAFSPDGHRVAFVRRAFNAGNSGIFIKEIAGDKLWQLTRGTHDCCPTWSPDGRSIAFSREMNGEVGIYVAPSSGGPERRLILSGRRGPNCGDVDWSPDGKNIAFDSAGGIALLSVHDSAVRMVTEAPPQSEDWGPKFSPDGRRIVFVRNPQMGLPDEIMVTPTGESMAPVPVTSEAADVLGPPQWSADGHAILFATGPYTQPILWKISADERDSPVRLGESGWNPAVSRKGRRLAYERMIRNLSVWEMNLSNPAEKQVLIPLASSTDQGPGPQFSPDGKKLAYMSDQSGTLEIWVSDRDGRNPHQLTMVGGAGSPRWSPDSKAIVFDAHDAIFVVKIDDMALRTVVKDQFENLCPSWSRNGKWIYFASSRTGRFEVWRVREEGGTPLQLTLRGGHAALESLDGKYVYYAKTSYANPEIWRMPANGGEEKMISPLVRPATWASWAVVPGGILFAGPSGEGAPVLSLFDMATHRVMTLGNLDVVPFWLGATTDGREVLFDRPGTLESQITLVENFR